MSTADSNSSTPLFSQIGTPSVAMDSETSFFLAIKNNHVEVVEKLLRTKSVDVDHKFAPENKPAVFLAVEVGHREIVACLIRYGCSVNQGDRRSETPLHQAVRDRRKDLIELLLRERAKICVLNSDRLNALHLAVYLRCLDIVKILVVAHASAISDNHLALVFRSDTTGIVSPFSLAYSKGYDEIVTYFLSLLDKESAKKFFTCRRLLDCTNPFHYVLRLEEETVLALLRILPSADFLVSMPNDYMKWSPLHLLAQADHVLLEKSGRMASLLLIHGSAPPDVRDINGRTPLHLAIIRRNVHVIEALLRAGSRTDVRDHHGNSALHYACLAHSYSLAGTWAIEQLLAFGLDLSRERWIPTAVEYERRAYSQNPVLIALCNLKESNALTSLQRLCRTKIRTFLGSKADSAIETLDCVPQAMKTFLLVKNEPELLDF